MTYKNTEQKAKNVNTNITQWKTDIATAISNKGVQTSATDNKATFVKNINNIVSGGGFEPGSIIPIDLLEPPTETTYTRSIGNLASESTIISYRYNNKICYTDSEKLCIFDMETHKDKYFPKWNTSNSVEYALPITEHIIACAYVYSSYTRYFALIDLENETIIKNINLSQYTGDDGAKLSSNSPDCYAVVKVEDSYFILYGGYNADYCMLVKITSDDTVTLKYLKTIANRKITYPSTMITDGEKLFITTYDGTFSVSTDLQLIALNTVLTSSYSGQNITSMILNNDHIYVSVSRYLYKLDINTLKETKISYKYVDCSLKQLDDNLLMSFTAFNAIPTDSYFANAEYRTITFYNKDLEVLHKYTDPQSFISSAGIFEENSKKYILLEMIDGRMIKMDADNFNVIWDVQYGANRNETFYKIEPAVDFYKVNRICHFYNDKLYLFRRTVSSISNDPKYTVKAQALLEYPQVLQLLRKGDE